VVDLKVDELSEGEKKEVEGKEMIGALQQFY